MSMYRITSNGLKFRIEKMSRSFWRRQEQWSPINFGNGFVTYVHEYSSRADAEADLERIMDLEVAESRGWQLV